MRIYLYIRMFVLILYAHVCMSSRHACLPVCEIRPLRGTFPSPGEICSDQAPTGRLTTSPPVIAYALAMLGSACRDLSVTHSLPEGKEYSDNRLISLVPGEGLEPPAFGLQNRCTTTVLTRQEAKQKTGYLGKAPVAAPPTLLSDLSRLFQMFTALLTHCPRSVPRPGVCSRITASPAAAPVRTRCQGLHGFIDRSSRSVRTARLSSVRNPLDDRSGVVMMRNPSGAANRVARGCQRRSWVSCLRPNNASGLSDPAVIRTGRPPRSSRPGPFALRSDQRFSAMDQST